MVKHLGMLLLAAVAGYFCLEFGHTVGIPGVASFVTPAAAVVGRPLTPVSVAGVARRTARRCAVGVYYC